MDFFISLITQSEQPEFCSGQLSGPQEQFNFQDGRRTRLVCGQSHPPLLGAGSVMGLGADGMKGEVFWGNLPCPHSKEKVREREGLFCQNFSIFSYRWTQPLGEHRAPGNGTRACGFSPPWLCPVNVPAVGAKRVSRVNMSQLNSVCVTGHRKRSIYTIQIEESQHQRNKNTISTPQTIFCPPGQSTLEKSTLWVLFNTRMVSLNFCDLYLFWPALFSVWNEDPSCVGFVFPLSNVEP